MFMIGLSLGLVIGFAIGAVNAGNTNVIYFLMQPIAAILITFICST